MVNALRVPIQTVALPIAHYAQLGIIQALDHLAVVNALRVPIQAPALPAVINVLLGIMTLVLIDVSLQDLCLLLQGIVLDIMTVKELLPLFTLQLG